MQRARIQILSIFAFLMAASSAAGTKKPKEFREFEVCAQRLLNSPRDPQLFRQCSDLADLRKNAVLALMKKDPASAIAFSAPDRFRNGMPQAIAEKLEKRVSGRGDLKIAIARPPQDSFTSIVSQHVELNGETYDAYTYGRRVNQVAENIPLHGVLLDGRMAVAENPVRVLEASEVEELKVRGVRIKGICPRSGNPVSREKSSSSITVDIGGEFHYLCDGGTIHLENLNAEYIANEGGSLPSGCGHTIRPTTWTTGEKTFLYIRVNYPDDPSEPQTLSSAQSMMAGMNNYMKEASYGKISFVGTYTPLLTLPKTKAEYNAMSDRGDSAILSDGRAMALAAGYDPEKFTLYAVRFQGAGGGYSGKAYVGSRGMWMKSSSTGIFAHETGHNLGLWHSNFWSPSGSDPMSLTGTNGEYGNPFSVMGSSGNMGHFTAFEKKLLNWLPSTSVYKVDASVSSAPASYVTRISTFDYPNQQSSHPYSIEINAFRPLALDFRTKFSSTANGLTLHFVPWSQSNCGVQLIDTTPGSSGGKNDSGIAIGRTFNDPLTGISITPLGKNGASPDMMDVRIDLDPVSPIAQKLSISGSTTSIAAGSDRQFTATASDQFGHPIGSSDLQWNASGGTVSSNGIWTAPAEAGSYEIWAKSGTLESNRLTVLVYISGANSIALSPLNPSVNEGETVTFTAKALDKYGVALKTQPSFTWSATGGSISSSGVYTGNTSGTHQVTATAGTLKSSTSVTVKGLGIASISITPSSFHAGFGEKRQLKAVALNSSGVAVSPQPAFVWSSGSCGSVSQAGEFTAGSAIGQCMVSASAKEVTGSVTATVHAPISVSITSPVQGSAVRVSSSVSVQLATSSNVAQVQVNVNGKQICALSAAPFTCSWTAPRRASSYRIEAQAFDENGFSASANPVTIQVVK